MANKGVFSTKNNQQKTSRTQNSIVTNFGVQRCGLHQQINH